MRIILIKLQVMSNMMIHFNHNAQILKKQVYLHQKIP